MSDSRLRHLIAAGTAAAIFAAAAPALPQDADSGICNVAEEPADLDFTLPGLDGREVTLSDYRDRVILLDFWATWCPPCRDEIPNLVDLYEEYRDAGFVVLGVSVDDPVSRLEPYVAELEVTYPILIGEGRYDLRDAFGPLAAFPTSFLIARGGTLCVKHVGIAGKEQLEKEINALL